jgi:YhcH/YjgK/YiaL family protein
MSRTDLATLPVGRHSIDTDRVFLIVGQEIGRGAVQALESHRRYIDIQYVVDGVEQIGWKPTEGLAVASEYDPERDIMFYHDVPTTWLTIPSGHFAIFFPADAHAPLGGTGPVHKVVAKILVDWNP